MDEETQVIQENTGKRSWRELWQLPTLAAAVVLLTAGNLGVVLTKPKPDVNGYLRQAEVRITRAEYPAALESLNEHVRPHVDAPYFKKEQLQRFHVLRGRAIGRAQRELIQRQAANDESVLAEFASAEQAGAVLGGGWGWRAAGRSRA